MCVCSALHHGIGGVASRHFWNSCTYSGGKSVGDDAMNCPSLTYVAPSSSHILRSRISLLVVVI